MHKIHRILVVFLLMIISNNVYAYDYDSLLMRAQADIFPKIILLDKGLVDKLESEQIIINIIYSGQEKNIAMQIKKLIHKKYKEVLGGKNLVVNEVDFKDFDKSSLATAYFLLKGPVGIYTKITKYAANQQRLVFSYDYKDFEKNSLVSVLVREKTYIYLNKKAIHDYDIKFLPLFYKIVKVIE